MGRKYCSTGTVTLASSGANNTVIAAPNPLSDGGGPRENFIRRLWVERTDTATDVTLIFLNSASPTPRELLPRITLNSDKGAVMLEFDDETEVGIGGGLAFVVDASVGNKARMYCEYHTSAATNWPA